MQHCFLQDRACDETCKAFNKDREECKVLNLADWFIKFKETVVNRAVNTSFVAYNPDFMNPKPPEVR